MRILIVDDEPVCLRLMHAVLKPYGEITEARDGRSAMLAFRAALLERRPFGLVTLDIMMPDMDGHSTLVALRSMELLTGILPGQGTPIFMTSALDDGQHVLGAFRDEASGYLTKPLDLAKLSDLCRAHGIIP